MKRYRCPQGQTKKVVRRGSTKLQVPEGLSPLEQAMWTLTVFTQQVTTFVEDADEVLRDIVDMSDDPHPLRSVVRRRRETRRRGGVLRKRAS